MRGDESRQVKLRTPNHARRAGSAAEYSVTRIIYRRASVVEEEKGRDALRAQGRRERGGILIYLNPE